MARTESAMLALGSPAPPFELMDALSGEQLSLTALAGDSATLIMFICNHCPFVKHIEQDLRDLAGDYKDTGVAIIAINANDADSYPEDAPQYMAAKAYPFPYLYDVSQSVARAYQAACTPDFFVFDKDLKLAYRGQFDQSRPGNDVETSGIDVRAALDQLLANKPVNPQQKPSLGCSIKWRTQATRQ